MSTLADRIRGVLQGANTPSPIAPVAVHPPGAASGEIDADLKSALGGERRDCGDALCFVVESRRKRSSRHGHTTVGAVAEQLRTAVDEVPLLAGFPLRAPFVFFDLETTGLSGGAGTYAFLVGCGWFDDDDGFVTRQFMLVRLADERALLTSVANELSRAGALVSFNGKSFDGPLIETRYLYHRLEWSGASLPHLDMLHVARRFWKRGDAVAATGTFSGPVDSSCSLGALERQLLGHRRRGDVPGVEIPERYYQFIRSGDARPLAPVLEHNRLDLFSLAALTGRAVQLIRRGPAGACDPREALGLGWIYARAGLERPARDAYERAVDLSTGMPAIQVESLRRLALLLRGGRQYGEAAGYWRRILDVPCCPSHIAREASEALAIHHEHRIRDLEGARRFALDSLEGKSSPTREQAVRHRLDRIDRKLERSKAAPALLFELSDVGV